MISFFEKSEYLNSILNKLKHKSKTIFIESIIEPFKSFLYAYLIYPTKNKNVIIIADNEKNYNLYANLNNLKSIFKIQGDILLYPEDDSLIYKNINSSKEILKLRANVFQNILEKKKNIIITNIDAISEKIESLDKVKKTFIQLKTGEYINLDEIEKILVENSYKREVKIEDVFEFSVRGNIIDIFSPSYEYPVRLELFDNKIESIRFFSLDTYGSLKKVDKVKLLLFNPSKKGVSSIIDYFSNENTLIILDEIESIKKEIIEKVEKIKKYLHSDLTEHIFDLKTILRKLKKFYKIKTSVISKKIKKIKIRHNPSIKGRIEYFIKYIREYTEKGYKIFIFSETEGENKNLIEIIKDKEKNSNILLKIQFLKGDILEGFIFDEIKICVLTYREIFNKEKEIKIGKIKDKNVKKIKHFTELKKGDIVVHSQYGIGVFEGIKTLDVGKNRDDFISLKFARDDRLYLPIYNINLVHKYIGGENPSLTKLGSSLWRKTKEEIEKEVKKIAEELLYVFAKREIAEATIYPADDERQKQFEEEFIYEETEDQKKAIEDVKKDMESNKIMDRLICGDAGFGKTEVAMRAAFKAVNYGKQVLLLTSTTLLAQQHFHTFSNRMAGYDINIKVLSRITKDRERRKIIEEVKTGKIDILIGTHAILSNKINFLDLGLMIIDEEQHFGAKVKENLRKKYPSADILTLTATPIPRTLYLSLSGIRDISIINTPPVNKKPIETFVVEEKLSIVKEIILREILRGGEVFYVHNNIKTIYRLCEILTKNLPNVKFRIAHGKLKKKELENIMIDFLNKKFDVLLTTTIIESGLDMPDVNTIIISNAEKFGLSQLYQLRGRVGRRDKQAYAYLLVKNSTNLSEEAKLRLKTVESFIDHGSGFKLAMKDLEIRGSGDILGIKQHGKIERVGFDLYFEMLEDAIKKIKGEEIKEKINTEININIDAYIPDSYIWDISEKLRIYKRLFLSKNFDEVDDIYNYLNDVWGRPVEEVKNILFIAKLRIFGNDFKILEITEKNRYLIFKLKDDTLVKEKIKHNKKIIYKNSEIKIKFEDKEEIIKIIKEVFY